MRWTIAAGQALRLRRWDQDYVLYNERSGDTHQLGQDSGALLEALRGGPADTATLAARLGQAAGLAVDEALLAEVHALLTELETLSVLEGRAC